MIGHLQITLDERGLFNYSRWHKYLILKMLSDPAASLLTVYQERKLWNDHPIGPVSHKRAGFFYFRSVGQCETQDITTNAEW